MQIIYCNNYVVKACLTVLNVYNYKNKCDQSIT